MKPEELFGVDTVDSPDQDENAEIVDLGIAPPKIAVGRIYPIYNL